MIEKMVLIEGAYFYNYKKTISKAALKSAFKNVSSHKKGNYIENKVKQNIVINGKNLLYSLCIFKFEQLPTFLKGVADRELKYAYILVIEYENYVIISKKNISGFEKIIKNNISGLDYNLISKVLVDEDTKFEKITMNNMDVSDNVIRKKNIEAINLKDSFSTFGSNKSIINNLRIKEDEARYALSLNTSRINKISKKSNFEGYCQWIVSIVEKLQNFTDQNNYIDYFAKPLNFKENIASLEPNNILILLSELKNESFLEGMYYRRGSKKREISIDAVIDNLEKVKSITKIINGSKVEYLVGNSLDKSLKLKINKGSISLVSKKLSNIILVLCDGEEIDLLEYLNKRHDYIICFNNIDIVYRFRKLFKDSQLMGNLDNFLSVFIDYEELKTISSEKGDLQTTSTKFESNSLFDFVETHLVSSDDYVICDDLGNEWADHISISNGKAIKYFHSKHSSLGFRASSFHEVVSQAQKNIGNLFPSRQDLERKFDKWETKYSTTDIERLRKGSITTLIDNFVATSTTPNTEKTIFLVVDFISKNSLKEELRVLKSGVSKPKNETIQILWLLSSLISSCQESNVNVYITCQP